ncbi:MAG: homoserine kinase [Candidatus Aerophobetes bacterium]|nr:homoserine kinase [Candidatus Aerophobetes bacterium]
MKKVRVRVPASTTNLGPGFDCLGLALKLYNVVEMERIERDGVIIEIKGEGENELPRNEKNIIFPAVKSVYDRVGKNFSGLRIREVNNIPLGRGLGSSAATRLAGIIAANALLEAGMRKDEILNLAAQLDGHPDNVSASLFGGLVIVTPDKGRLKYLKLDIPDGLKIVLSIPEMEVLTEKARGILPKNILLSEATFNLSRVAMLTSSLIKGEWEYLGLGTEDKVHQPRRKSLIPGMEEVFKSARKAGARGVFLSGAGSGIAAFADQREEKIGEAMREAFLRRGVKSRVMVLEVDRQGVLLEIGKKGVLVD